MKIHNTDNLIAVDKYNEKALTKTYKRRKLTIYLQIKTCNNNNKKNPTVLYDLVVFILRMQA